MSVSSPSLSNSPDQRISISPPSRKGGKYHGKRLGFSKNSSNVVSNVQMESKFNVFEINNDEKVDLFDRNEHFTKQKAATLQQKEFSFGLPLINNFSNHRSTKLV